MLTKEFAHHFAEDWIDSWNAHDLDRIMAHYADDFEMTSPNIVSLMGVASGSLKGKAQVRDYWAKALARHSGLKFTLRQSTYSVGSIALYYDNDLGAKAIEWFLFDENSGLVVKSIAHYDAL